MGRMGKALLGGLLVGLIGAGQARAAVLEVNPYSHRAKTVSALRFQDLVAQQAARWQLAVAKEPTTAPVGSRDSVSVVGFYPDLPGGTLGRRFAWHRGDEIVEQDIGINPRYRWEPGPGYPNYNEFDLATIVIHELAHVADPSASHAPRCASLPLADGLASGEWWRGSDDWFKRGCGGAPMTSAGKKRAKT